MKKFIIFILFLSFCGGTSDSQQTSEKQESNEATQQSESNETTQQPESNETVSYTHLTLPTTPYV